jgi:hypothetical protein
MMAVVWSALSRVGLRWFRHLWRNYSWHAALDDILVVHVSMNIVVVPILFG